MGLFKELTEMSREDLLELLDSAVKDNRKEHDLFVKLGSLGVSPSYMSKYLKANEIIKKSVKV